MATRSIQQFGGAVIALISAWLSIWISHQPLTENPHILKGAVLFPAFTVIGIGLIFCPGYREERLARGEDISGIHGRRWITARWWAILVLALFMGIGHLMLLLSKRH